MSALRVLRVPVLGSLLIASAWMVGSVQSSAAAPKAKKDARSSAMLAAHNRARAQVGSPPLRWSSELARHAQKWADRMARDCTLRPRSDGRYGENLGAAASNMGAAESPPDRVVGHWLAEKQCWEYGAFKKGDQCKSSCASRLQSTGCGHYTQVVWSTTRRVG